MRPRARTRAVAVALVGMVAAAASVGDGLAGQKLYDKNAFFQRDRSTPQFQTMPASDRAVAAGHATPPPVWTGAPLPLRTARDLSSGRANSGSGIADIFSELVVGFWRHDPEQDNNESDTLDLNAEIIFRKLRLFDVENPIADVVLSPRPLIGGSANNKNKTPTAYAGLNWRDIFANDVFIAGSLGVTYHTGSLDRATRQCFLPEICGLAGNRAFDDDRREVTLGSRILSRESIAMGYRFGGRHSVSFYGAHMSNGGLADDNDGMNFVGIRYGYSLE